MIIKAKKMVKRFFRFLLFLFVFTGFIGSAILAVITLIPDASVSKVNLFGYRSYCPFVPGSTIILIISTLLFGYFFRKKYKDDVCAFMNACKVKIKG